MKSQIKVAGYVKLAKLWEKRRESAVEFHHRYYAKKFAGFEDCELIDVYIDITGQKEIIRRPEMLRLMNDCCHGRVNLIAAQTKGYLAANTTELSFLIKFLFDLDGRVDIITEDEDYQFDTLTNPDHQKEALQEMVDKLVSMNPEEYTEWLKKVQKAMQKLGLE